MNKQEQREKFADELLEYATKEEEVLYCKIYEMDADAVLKELGRTKEETIRAFIVTWMVRMQEDQDAKRNQ